MERGDLTCDEVRSLLECLVEGDLEGRKERAVRKHLASCEACRSAFALDVALVDALRTSPDGAFESVAGRVMERLEARRRRFMVLRWGAIASAVCVIGFIADALGLGLFEYTLRLVSGGAASRPEIAALGKIVRMLAGLVGSVGSLILEGAAGDGSAYLPYVLAWTLSGCLFVMALMYMMGRWLREPREVRS